jgi:hypothetical protein
VDDTTSSPQPLEANKKENSLFVVINSWRNCRGAIAFLPHFGDKRISPPDLFDAKSAKIPLEIKLNCAASIASTTRRPTTEPSTFAFNRRQRFTIADSEENE